MAGTQEWRLGSDEFPFQTGDFFGSMFIFRGVHLTYPKPNFLTFGQYIK